LRLAALFHDLGKPQTRKMEKLPIACCEKDQANGVWTFYRHEEVSASLCRSIMTRLRYSNTVINNVCHLVNQHMFQYTDEWSDAAVRRFIARVGEANLENIYKLRRADSFGFAGKEPRCRSLINLIERVNIVRKDSKAFSLKDLAVSGNDLMTAGIPSGKTMGIILNQLLETVLDDPSQNTREKLLEIAGQYVKQFSYI
jgi:putative nucleotidyltransferase with HDIG domain